MSERRVSSDPNSCKGRGTFSPSYQLDLEGDFVISHADFYGLVYWCARDQNVEGGVTLVPYESGFGEVEGEAASPDDPDLLYFTYWMDRDEMYHVHLMDGSPVEKVFRR